MAVLDGYVGRLNAAKRSVDRDGLLWAAGFRTLGRVLGEDAGPGVGSAAGVKTPDQFVDEYVSGLRGPVGVGEAPSSYVPWAERVLEVRWLARQAGLTVTGLDDARVLDTVVQLAHRQYRKDFRGARPLGPLGVPALRRVVEVKLGVGDSAPLSMDVLRLVADKSGARRKWEQSHAFQAWARRQVQRSFGRSEFAGGGARWHWLDGGYRQVVTLFQRRAEKWEGMADSPAERRREQSRVRELLDTTGSGRKVPDGQIEKLVRVRRKYFADYRNRWFTEDSGFADYRWMTQQFLDDTRTDARNIERLAAMLAAPSPEVVGWRPSADGRGPTSFRDFLNSQRLPSWVSLRRDGNGRLGPEAETYVRPWVEGLRDEVALDGYLHDAVTVAQLSGGLVDAVTVRRWWRESSAGVGAPVKTESAPAPVKTESAPAPVVVEGSRPVSLAESDGYQSATPDGRGRESEAPAVEADASVRARVRAEVEAGFRAAEAAAGAVANAVGGAAGSAARAVGGPAGSAARGVGGAAGSAVRVVGGVAGSVARLVGGRAAVAAYKAARDRVHYERTLIGLATAGWKSRADHQGAVSYRPSLPGHTPQEIAERSQLITSFHNVLDISSFVPDVAGWLNRITPASKGSFSAGVVEAKLKSSLGKAFDEGIALETADGSFGVRLWPVPVGKPVSGAGNWVKRGKGGSTLAAGKAELRWFAYREAGGSRFDGSLFLGEVLGGYQAGVGVKGEVGGQVLHSRQWGSRSFVSNNPARYQFLRMKEDGGRVEVDVAWVARVQDRATGRWRDFTFTTAGGDVRRDTVPYLVAQALLPHDETLRNNGGPSDPAATGPDAHPHLVDPDYLVPKQISDRSEFPLEKLDFAVTRLDLVARVMTVLRQQLSPDDFAFWGPVVEGKLNNTDLAIKLDKLRYSGDDIQRMFRINEVRGGRSLNLTLTDAQITSVVKRSEVDMSNELRFDDIRGNIARSMAGADRGRRAGGGFFGQIKIPRGLRFGFGVRHRWHRGQEAGRNHRALITSSKRLGGLLQAVGFDFAPKLNVEATSNGEVTSRIDNVVVDGGSADALLAAVDVYHLRRADGQRLFVANPKLVERMQAEVAKPDAGS
ncbi:hypothetical protein ACFY2R_29510, partial [Micromonospora olivasterospora]|uniref:hypothetical protein n=1 Tax=Micromonospora olivasterospora TaxID=1880 RepID=UPI0036A66074